MSFNRNFNPKIWEQQPRDNYPTPYANNQTNYYQNQGSFQYQNTNFNQNFQNSNIRPLLGLPVLNQQDHNQQFRNNYSNNHNQDNYRRPGPACARNNFSNKKPQRWNRKPRQDDFNNLDSRQSETFENYNNNFSNNRPPHRPLSTDPPAPPPSGNDPQKFTSLVEHLKAVQNSKKSAEEIDAMCAKNASEASKKLMSQIKTMDKEGVRDLINNPKTIYKKTVMNYQAREKLREQIRKKLKKLGDESDTNDLGFEPDECIDYDKVPGSLIAQIGKTMDLNLEQEEMDLSESINEGSTAGSLEDGLEVVTKNLGNDFLMGSEMLLMNGFSLLAENDEPEMEAASRQPPLPAEKPPSPPPLPVPPPSDEMVVQPAFSSADQPWTLPKNRPTVSRLEADEDITSARNPDPPSFVTTENLPKRDSEEVRIDSQPKPPQSKPPAVDEPTRTQSKSITPIPPTSDTPSEAPQPANHQGAAESGRRANETYGDYRRRLAEEKMNNDFDKEDTTATVAQNEKDNITSNSFNSNHQPQMNQRSDNSSRPLNEFNSNRSEPDRNNWIQNRNRNQNNSWQDRKSRFETDRGRDRNSNNFQRNLSRDNNSHDGGGRFEDLKDGHNYRFQNEKNSTEPSIDHLNSLLNPKPLQFKGSFNKRLQNSGNFGQSGPAWNRNNQRSRSRNRTPVNNSVERDFEENLLPSPNDVRPCLSTLKKVMEIDAELLRIQEKIHGIDKVISNLQLERVGYQKSCTGLQHDRKVLFDNMMKRAMSGADVAPAKESSQAKDRTPTEPTNKPAIEKKLQNIVDQKKRKHEDQPDESRKKKLFDEVETTSAAAKAAKLQKEREEEERRVKLVEKKRLKKLRREREEAERLRLEERVRQEAAASTIIKIEPAEKSTEKLKSKENPKSTEKPKKSKKILIMPSETLQIEKFKTRLLSVKVQRVPVAASYVDDFSSFGSVAVDLIEWNKWCSVEAKAEKLHNKVEEAETVSDKAKPSDVVEDPLAVPQDPLATPQDPLAAAEDPLAIDETSINPPTPGSNLTDQNEEDSMLIEVPIEHDYSEWTGNFSSHEHPIVHLQAILNKFIVCATEGGKILKYRICDGKLAAVFSKHKEICNSFIYDYTSGSIYTVSSDGFLHKIKFKTFQLVSSENFNEPLQVVEKSKAGIFVGTKSGKIFKLKTDLTEREEEPICELGVLILCMKATKEGSRNILLVSSRTHAIQVRDAMNGLLLRTLSDNLAGVSIYDMLIEGSTIYCGSNRHEIFAVDFTTGALKKSLPCGAGAICVKLYKSFLIAACYDGNIYIFNTKNNDAAVNICGPSNMLLAMDLWNDKIIASTKDATMKIMNIPT